MRQTLRTFAIVSLLLLATGCGTSLFQRRTVYVQNGDVVRLREPVKAKVWVKVNGEWEPSAMTIPEGWYALHLNKKQLGEGE